MSGMISPPSPVAGATQGMGGPNPQAQMQAKFQTVLAGVREIFQVFNAIPGVDKAKVQQAAQLMGQATQLLATAVPKGGAGQAPGAPPSDPSASPAPVAPG